MPTSQKQAVIKAIGDLGRKVTTADVATKTGLPVLEVQQQLNQVAADTRGHLQVSKSGDILYTFAPGFSNAYLANGIKAVLLVIGAKILGVGYYLLRISFGVALIASLLILIIILIAIAIAFLTAMKGRDDDREGGGDFFNFGGSGFHFSFWDWMILRDLFWWNSYGSYTPIGYDYNKPTIRKRSKSNFLLNAFSFLFGDGDPNEGLEQKKWQLIAQVIKKNNNVVTAEQLAPYTGADPKNEDGALPVLVRFNGRPEVTESGNLVYVFESMHTTAADQKINPPASLREFPWKFTNVSEGELLPVFIVAGLNIALAWWLWNFFLHPGDIAMALLHSWPFLTGLTTALAIYGTIFIAVPVIRHVINQVKNQRIEARNTKRESYSRFLGNPDAQLSTKLAEARSYRIRDKQLTQKDMVYDTDKDSLDQDDALSEKFKNLESKQDSREDKGVVIDIRKKLQEDFDASP